VKRPALRRRAILVSSGLLTRPRAILALALLAAVAAGSARAARNGSSRPAGPAVTRAARSVVLGFADGAFTGPLGATWLARAASAGAGVVRINVGWVAPDTPTRPPGFDARNPADPHYDFTAADEAVRLAAADGLRVILEFSGAPRWAEGADMPTDAPPGTWRPDPRAIEDYGIALARRYSGRFPDPADPARALPRVWAFQLWNEPNLPEYLNPQWVGNNPASPTLYRAMLNAFYVGVKSVAPRALVVTAGTGPFGDPWIGGRIMPAMFWRALLCLRQADSGLVGVRCSNPAHFDVLAHHPYSVGDPGTKALNPDDVSIPDIGKLTTLLRTAERLGRALPRIHHPMWVTEVGYNTDPPNPQGVPMQTDASWVSQTLALLWRQGVSLITWNTIVDEPPVPSYSVTSQAGMYFVDGQPKPALAAFRFPFTAWRLTRSSVEVWARPPSTGTLAIQRRIGSSWRTVVAQYVHIHSTFLTHLVDTRKVTLRAVVHGHTSVPFALG
jgi:hypothetical protein